ncbi:MAG: response regulator [Gammaproteobacteria bacterium]|jgi:CheY-like chemotaxis protein
MPQGSPRILIVDDEPFIVLGLRTYLEDEGWTVEGAGSGEEALEMISSGGRFDVCILDQRLPGISGDATLRAMHALCPDLRFIIHTGDVGYTLPDDLQALAAGPVRLFKKPLLDMEPLAGAIRDLVRH